MAMNVNKSDTRQVEFTKFNQSCLTVRVKGTMQGKNFPSTKERCIIFKTTGK